MALDDGPDTRRKRKKRRRDYDAGSQVSVIGRHEHRFSDEQAKKRQTRAQRRRALAARDEPQTARTLARRREQPDLSYVSDLPRLSGYSGPPPTERQRTEARAQAIAAQAIGAIAPEVYQSVTTAPGARITGEDFFGPGLGPLLPIRDGRPASEANLKWLPLDVAGVFPVARGPRAAAAATREIRGGASISGIAAPGSAVAEAYSAPIFRGRQLTGTRTVRQGDESVQFPSSPSLVTAYGQRLLDRASERLGRGATRLRESERMAFRGVGKALTPVTARARVPKRAGRLVEAEGRRRRALRAQEIRTIRAERHALPVPGRSATRSEVAHHWWAQLPRALRNVEGLKRVRAQLDLERKRYATGEFMRPLSERIASKGEYFNQYGQRIPSRLSNDFAIHNIYDDANNLIGSLVYDARAGRDMIYVESVFIRPEFRKLASFKRLIAPLIEDGRPIAADIQNPRLQRLFERAVGRGVVAGRVLPSQMERTIGKGDVPEDDMPPLRTVRGEDPDEWVGRYVKADDRKNFGRVEAIDPEAGTATVFFINRGTGARATREMPLDQLRPAVDDAEIALRIRDLGENINKIDRVIAKPPRLSEAVIESLDVLDQDRTGKLVRAGFFDEDTALARRGIISRWLGLEPTGEEIYMGHRAARVAGARESLLPGGVSVGKTRAPEGAATRNELARVRQGRVRQDLEAAIEDWQAAEVYEFHNIAKEQLGRMGEDIDMVAGPKRGHIIVNPRGHEIPRRWKRDPAEQAELEGFDPDDVLIDDVEEYLHNYMAETPTQIREMFEKAAAAGHLDELRQVPKDVVKRYYGQFLPTKITVATPGVKEGASAVGKGADVLNDMLYISLIYSNPGYIPANLVGNLAMATAQQGVFLPANLIRAGQLLTTGPRRVRDLVLAEVSQGPTLAVASTTSPLRAIPRVVGAVPDNGPRTAAFLHEAARMGIISKAKPRLSRRDYEKLEAFLTDPNARPILNDVSDRAVQAMVDFNRLGPLERALAKRLLFVWPWIRGATRYPGRFALDHPVRSAALAYGTVEGQDYLEERTMGSKEGPPWLEQAIKVGQTTVDGVEYPTVLPTRTISLVATPWEMIETATAQPGARTFSEFLNPLLPAAFLAGAGKREGQDVYYDVGYGEAAQAAGERLLPQFNLARDLWNPPEETGLYPEDTTRIGRAKRASRIFPVAIDPERARELATLSDEERRQARYEKELDERVTATREAFEGAGYDAPDDLEDLERRRIMVQVAEDTLKDDSGADRLTEAQKVLALITVAGTVDDLEEYHDGFMAYWQNARGHPLDQAGNPNGPMHQLSLYMRKVLGFDRLEEYRSIAERIRDAERVGAGG